VNVEAMARYAYTLRRLSKMMPFYAIFCQKPGRNTKSDLKIKPL
jgi:hypothetical protein